MSRKLRVRVIPLSQRNDLVIAIHPDGREHLRLLSRNNVGDRESRGKVYRVLQSTEQGEDPESIVLAVLAFNLNKTKSVKYCYADVGRLLWKLSYFGAKKTVFRIRSLMRNPLNGYPLSAVSEFERILLLEKPQILGDSLLQSQLR